MKIIKAFNELTKKRREDVSIKVFFYFLLSLSLTKLKYFFINHKDKQTNTCTIVFPPAFGLGDLIILSKIVDIVLESKKFKKVRVFSNAPWVHSKRKEVDYLKLTETKTLLNSDNFLFPDHSFLNHIIAYILGSKKCIGYKRRRPFFYLNKEKYFIDKRLPYFKRLKPFLIYFDVKKSLKPNIWSKKIIKEREKRNDYYKIKDILIKEKKNKNYVIAISTYNFHYKFRPNLQTILETVKKESNKLNQELLIIILGSTSNSEQIYNKILFEKLKILTKNIYNSSGLLNLNQAIDIIIQSDYYIGANNGLSNIAQITGSIGVQLFTGPEKPLIRKFSKKMTFKYLKPND